MFCSFFVIARWRRLTTGAVDSLHCRVVREREREGEREVTISHFLFALAVSAGQGKRVPNGSRIFCYDRNRKYCNHFLQSSDLIGNTW